MRDLKLDQEGDLMISEFDLRLTTDSEIVEQRIRQALLTFKGEWFLNTQLGIPYYESILEEKNSLQAIKAILVDAIKKVEGVKELTKFEIKYDNDSRALAVNFNVMDDFNNLLVIEI
jgi:hypothetical protein